MVSLLCAQQARRTRGQKGGYTWAGGRTGGQVKREACAREAQDAILMASAQESTGALDRVPCWALQGWGGGRRGLGSGKLFLEAKTEAPTGLSRAGSLSLSQSRHAGGSSGLSQGTSMLRNSRFLSPLCTRQGEGVLAKGKAVYRFSQQRPFSEHFTVPQA